jgi:putative phosphoesterase
MPRLGLVSDTHGLLRPAVLRFLAGSDAIVHAGDIGAAEILEALAAVAPLTAVRGNNDTQAWAHALPEVATLSFAGTRLLVLHDLKRLRREQLDADVGLVVSGHSHRPHQEQRDGVLYLNPGSAGPRRFRLPVGVGDVVIDEAGLRARLVALDL